MSRCWSSCSTAGRFPAGKSQIDYATNIVKQHFATSSILFGLHQLIRGILRVFNRLTVSIASWLPIPGLDAPGQAGRRDHQHLADAISTR